MNKIRVGYFVNSSSNKMQLMGPRNVLCNHDHVKFWYLANQNFCPIPLYKKGSTGYRIVHLSQTYIYSNFHTYYQTDSSGNNG